MPIEISYITQELISLNRKQMRNLQKENNELSLTRKLRLHLLEVYIGTPPQKILLKLSTVLLGITIVSKKQRSIGYDHNLSSTYEIIHESHSNSLGSGSIVKDTIQFETSSTIDHFPFFLADIPQYSAYSYSGLLGLAFDNENNSEQNIKSSFDFFQYSSSLNKGYKKMIGLKAIDHNGGLMFLGDFPSEIKSNMKAYKTCSVITQPGKRPWECHLNAIYFEDYDLINVNQSVEMIIGGNIIIVSKEVYMIMIEKYFSEAMKQKICYYNKDDEDGENYIQVICNKEFNRSSIGQISLVFGKNTVKLSTEQLFYDDYGLYCFAIMADESSNKWYISPSMLYGTYVVFDRENKQVGFYAKANPL